MIKILNFVICWDTATVILMGKQVKEKLTLEKE